MRIAYRSGGGRGDYELAGSYNGVFASELLEKQFYYQITPDLEIDGRAKARRLAGKPRIRPEENGLHPYVIIYSILLLPSPRRALSEISKSDLITLSYREYVLSAIDLDLIANDATKVIFAPTIIWAQNQVGILKIDFAERMAVIFMLWTAARQNMSELGMLIQQHEAATIASDHSSIQKIAGKIQKNLGLKLTFCHWFCASLICQII